MPSSGAAWLLRRRTLCLISGKQALAHLLLDGGSRPRPTCSPMSSSKQSVIW